jgi:hypothetical protein
MRYQIPAEAPPKRRFSRLAVNPATPFLGGMLFGSFPAIVWSVANGYFLGCRDARRQALVGATGFLVIKAVGIVATLLETSGVLSALLGEHSGLARSVISSITVILLFSVLIWLMTRQEPIARYQNSLGKPLPWGLPFAGALILVNLFVVPLIDSHVPYFTRFWGKLI